MSEELEVILTARDYKADIIEIVKRDFDLSNTAAELLKYHENDIALALTELEKEELMEEKPHGVVFAKCPDGDATLLLDTGEVVRFNHEAPEVWEKWESLAEFFEENLTCEE